MAKGIGLIGNFRGKVGNMVGYNLKDSNNKQTQGVRVYQPIVKNPKTYAQAEQRAKLSAINATYRALKAVIDRGQETKAYGNKSRLAWLSGALKSFAGPYYVKGATVKFAALVPLTKGSLPSLTVSDNGTRIGITAASVTSSTDLTTIGKVSAALKADYPWLKDGDQITLVAVGNGLTALSADVFSFIIDTTSAVATSKFAAAQGKINYDSAITGYCHAVIVSREGDNGEHLRSTSALSADESVTEMSPFTPEDKEESVRSYMGASATTDWPEEKVQG